MNFKIKKLYPFGLIIEPLNGEGSIFDIDIDHIKKKLSEEHLIAFRGFKSFSNAEEFSEYCEKHGEISLWPFGKVLELIVHEKPKDHIFDNSYIPLHWDGMYREQVPATQVFHCVQAPGVNNKGGTTFVNTKRVLEKQSDSFIEYLSKISCTYSRKMEYYDSKTVAPILTEHHERGYKVIRYCQPPNSNDSSFVNHPGFEIEGIPKEEIKSFISKLNDVLYSPENMYTHQWQTGDIVFSDNHTLLHGREPFTKDAPRHIRRVQLLDKKPLNNPHLIHTK
ncbi:TauD/TfdA dioxygenase family protein [Tenacibaculum sp. C7A-26P2]|uniref:TauD/TfdA dioxygenase family protein n=1 Tax=Tenacibaculum sp. C7A-26P2 TaxID=3447504 RepID=UPI003F8760EA